MNIHKSLIQKLILKIYSEVGNLIFIKFIFIENFIFSEDIFRVYIKIFSATGYPRNSLADVTLFKIVSG